MIMMMIKMKEEMYAKIWKERIGESEKRKREDKKTTRKTEKNKKKKKKKEKYKDRIPTEKYR